MDSSARAEELLARCHRYEEKYGMKSHEVLPYHQLGERAPGVDVPDQQDWAHSYSEWIRLGYKHNWR